MKHHDQLRRIDLKVAVSGSAQLLKRATFEPLGPDRKSIIVPGKNFDVVTPAVEEDEQMPGKQIDLEVLLDQP
nr:hypothetical protein [Allorhodopirellula solitaria]